MEMEAALKKNRRAQLMPEELRLNLQRRLRRAEGQIRGVQKMVDEQRYCPDVLTQIAAIHESLRAVERLLLGNHLQHCATAALRSGDEENARQTYKELTDLFYKHAR
jgi:DNA-binding FrmR family transcriptional regulator